MTSLQHVLKKLQDAMRVLKRRMMSGHWCWTKKAKIKAALEFSRLEHRLDMIIHRLWTKRLMYAGLFLDPVTNNQHFLPKKLLTKVMEAIADDRSIWLTLVTEVLYGCHNLIWNTTEMSERDIKRRFVGASMAVLSEDDLDTMTVRILNNEYLKTDEDLEWAVWPNTWDFSQLWEVTPTDFTNLRNQAVKKSGKDIIDDVDYYGRLAA